MPRWKNKLDLADVFHDDAWSFEERRDEIVKRIRVLSTYALGEAWIEEIVENLAEASDVREFDSWWHEFYDWADEARVWVATF